MLAFMLAATVITAPVAPPPPTSVEESCEPFRLARIVAAPKEQQIANETDLDRRVAAALAEERRVHVEVVQAAETMERVRAAEKKEQIALALLALLALAMGLVAARRGSLPVAATAWALVAAAGWFGMSLGTHRAEVSATWQAATSHELLLRDCRGRLNETRAALTQSRVAHLIHDLGEADEDVWAWYGRMKNGGAAASLTEVGKLHEDLREAVKY